jgi:hypothetical protein
MQKQELFALSATTPPSIPVHGEVLLRGMAEARANFRRGIDLSANFSFAAQAQLANVSRVLSATFGAGASVSGGLSLQAAFPLDLFTEAGIVARFRAQIEAAAYVSATFSLSADAFYQLVDTAPSAGPLLPFIDILRDELAVEAGIWARAMFAAEILGEATLTGSLHPNATNGAGFTFSLQYAMGFIYGAGYHFVANIGISDPQRLGERLSAALSAAAITAAENFVAGLPAAEAGNIRPALTAFRFLAPVAARLPFQLGLDLAGMGPANAVDGGARSTVHAFIRTAQEQVLQIALDLVSAQLSDLFRNLIDVRALVERPQDEMNELIERLTALRDQAERLEALSPADRKLWLNAFHELVDLVDGFLASGLLPSDLKDDLSEPLVFLWAAGRLVARAVSWSSDPLRGVGEAFGQAPIETPSSGVLAARAAALLGKNPGAPLTFGDFVSILVRSDIASDLAQAAPFASDLLTWISQTLGTPIEQLIEPLFGTLAGPSGDAARTLLETLTPRLETAIHDEILERLLPQLKAQNPDDVALTTLLDDFVGPALAAVTRAVLPTLAALDTADEIVRLREALSSVALQTLLGFTLTSADVLLERAMTLGSGSLRGIANDVRQLAEGHPAQAALATIASEAAFPGGLTPAEAADILDLAANMLELLNGDPRRGLVEVHRALIRLGLGDDAGRLVSYQAMLSTDGPIILGDLEAAFSRVTDGMWQIALLGIERVLELAALYPLRKAQQLIEGVAEVARQAIVAAQQAVAWLEEEAAALVVRLNQLARQIEEFGRQLAADLAALADHLIGFVSEVIDRIRARGWQLIEPLVAALPEPLRDAVRKVYDGLFDLVRDVLVAPLQLLAAIADWVRDSLAASLADGTTSEDTVHRAVRDRIRGSAMPILDFRLAVQTDVFGAKVTLVDLGVITIGPDVMLGAATDVVMGNSVYQQTVTTAVQAAVARREAQSQYDITRATYENLRSPAQAATDLAGLLPGQDLTVEISRPAQESIGDGEQLFQVTIVGANRTFLRETLGVPRRISIILNGFPQDYVADSWTEIGGPGDDEISVRWSALIVPGPVLAPPGPVSAGPVPAAIRPMPVLPLPRLPFPLPGPFPTRIPSAFVLSVPAAATLSLASAIVLGPGVLVAGGLPPLIAEVPRVELPGLRDLSRALLSALDPERRPIGDPLPLSATGTVTVSSPPRVEFSQPRRTPAAVIGAVAARLRPEILQPPAAAGEPALGGGPAPAPGGGAVIGGVDLSTLPRLPGRFGLNTLAVVVTDGSGRTAAPAQREFFIAPPQPPRRLVLETPSRAASTAPAALRRIVIRNVSDETVSTTGMSLRDLRNNRLPLPARELAPGKTLRIALGARQKGLHWERANMPAGGDSEVIALNDDAGREIFRIVQTPGAAAETLPGRPSTSAPPRTLRFKPLRRRLTEL